MVGTQGSSGGSAINSSLGAGVGGALGGALGSMLAGPGGMDEYKKALALANGLAPPNVTWKDISPATLSMVARLNPDIYQAKIPDEVKLASDSPELRSAEMEGLQKMEEVAKQGLPLSERIAGQNAQRQLGVQQERGQEGVLRDLAARGRLGGGGEVAARMASMGQNAEAARGMGADLAQQSIQNKLGATTQAAGMASKMRGEDVNLSQQRADETNRWAQMLANIENQNKQYNAGAQERTQNYNTGTLQNLANTNAQNQQQTQTQNQMMGQQFTMANWNAALQKYKAQQDALNNMAMAEYAKQAATADQYKGLGQGIGGALL